MTLNTSLLGVIIILRMHSYSAVSIGTRDWKCLASTGWLVGIERRFQHNSGNTAPPSFNNYKDMIGAKI